MFIVVASRPDWLSPLEMRTFDRAGAVDNFDKLVKRQVREGYTNITLSVLEDNFATLLRASPVS